CAALVDSLAPRRSADRALVDVSRRVQPIVVLDPATTESGSGVAQAASVSASADARSPASPPRRPLRDTVTSQLRSQLPGTILRGRRPGGWSLLRPATARAA